VLRRLIVFLVLTVGILVAAFFGLTHRYTVASNAMEPTMNPGDDVAVFRFQDSFSSPHRKDVVVYNAPGRTGCGSSTKEVGRIIGLPGETVAERNGAVSVDGTPLVESYLKRAHRDPRERTWHVPQDAYLILGDNRRSPCALAGFVPKKQVVGTVFVTYWPGDRVSIS
jgi:signal peptidase I